VRLAAFLLTGALALSAQALPWRAAPALPWKLGPAGAGPGPCPAPVQARRPLTVRIAYDGKVLVTDDKGLIRMKLGLPGRPVKAWRDGGIPVPDLTAPLAFPQATPLQRGIGGMPVGAPDFRPALEGLLWILDDDGTILTVLHPASAQVVYLPLPGGQDPTLAFHPDRLEVRDTGGQGPRPSWSLHWLGLLPQFIQLGRDPAAGKPKGTALLPFPKE
jgi:hypothetical protein